MKNPERGDGKIGLIIMLLVLAAIIFVLVKVVPARVNAYELKDFLDTYTRNDCWSRTPDQIKKDIMEKATFLQLPLTPENIKVERRGSTIHVETKFDVPVDLKVYTMVLHYNFTQDAEHY